MQVCQWTPPSLNFLKVVPIEGVRLGEYPRFGRLVFPLGNASRRLCWSENQSPWAWRRLWQFCLTWLVFNPWGRHTSWHNQEYTLGWEVRSPFRTCTMHVNLKLCGTSVWYEVIWIWYTLLNQVQIWLHVQGVSFGFSCWQTGIKKEVLY